MAILNIVKDGDPVLHKTCRPVEKITPRILRLLDDMKDTLKDAQGVGLAAPQVGVLRRICIVENEEGEIYELINPRIIACSSNVQRGREGCLSLPGEWGIVERPVSVTVEAMNRDGETVQITGSDLTGRCFCHEIDHLDGILYKDKALRMLTEEEIERLSRSEE